jgi:hypothetical protein
MTTSLGIDPGPTCSAYCLLDEKQILAKGKVLNEELEKLIDNGFFDDVDSVAIEINSPYVEGNKLLFETSEQIGVLRKSLKMRWGNEDKIHRVFRKTVVAYWTGSARNGDKHVRAAMIYEFGQPGSKKDPGVTYGIVKDIWSALAIAAWNLENNPPKPKRTGPPKTVIKRGNSI